MTSVIAIAPGTLALYDLAGYGMACFVAKYLTAAGEFVISFVPFIVCDHVLATAALRLVAAGDACATWLRPA